MLYIYIYHYLESAPPPPPPKKTHKKQQQQKDKTGMVYAPIMCLFCFIVIPQIKRFWNTFLSNFIIILPNPLCLILLFSESWSLNVMVLRYQWVNLPTLRWSCGIAVGTISKSSKSCHPATFYYTNPLNIS